MKDYKFKSNSKLDSMIKSILANSKFSSFQEYIEWRIARDSANAVKRQMLS
jgi:hypothetical protein